MGRGSRSPALIITTAVGRRFIIDVTGSFPGDSIFFIIEAAGFKLITDAIENQTIASSGTGQNGGGFDSSFLSALIR